MDIDNIWQRIEALPSKINLIAAKDHGALSELAYLWLVTTGKTLRWDCRDCRHRAYTETTSINYDKLKTMSEKKFKLGSSQLLVYNQEHINNANLTDDLARAILTINPGAIEAFSDYPKNSDGSVDLSDEETEAPAEIKSKVKGKNKDAEAPAEEEIVKDSEI